MSEQMERTTFVYVGRRLTSKDTLAYAYVHESDPEDERLWAKPLYPGLTIGTEVEVDASVDRRRVFMNDMKVLGQTANDGAIAAWSVAEKVDIIRHGVIADNKRRAKEGVDPIRESLDEIRAAYNTIPRGLNSIGRRSAFLQYVTNYIIGD